MPVGVKRYDTIGSVSYTHLDVYKRQVTNGAGSGVIISEDGYILTNNHVVEGQSTVKVTTSDKQQYDATVVGTDDKTDIAVLKIDASGLTRCV